MSCRVANLIAMSGVNLAVEPTLTPNLSPSCFVRTVWAVGQSPGESSPYYLCAHLRRQFSTAARIRMVDVPRHASIEVRTLPKHVSLVPFRVDLAHGVTLLTTDVPLAAELAVRRRSGLPGNRPW